MAIKLSDKRNNLYVRKLGTLTEEDTFQKGEFFYVKMDHNSLMPGDVCVFNLNTSKCEYFMEDTSVETVEIDMTIRQSRRERNKQTEETEETAE
jgi:hypothetical protein